MSYAFRFQFAPQTPTPPGATVSGFLLTRCLVRRASTCFEPRLTLLLSTTISHQTRSHKPFHNYSLSMKSGMKTRSTRSPRLDPDPDTNSNIGTSTCASPSSPNMNRSTDVEAVYASNTPNRRKRGRSTSGAFRFLARSHA